MAATLKAFVGQEGPAKAGSADKESKVANKSLIIPPQVVIQTLYANSEQDAESSDEILLNWTLFSGPWAAISEFGLARPCFCKVVTNACLSEIVARGPEKRRRAQNDFTGETIRRSIASVLADAKF